MAASVATGGRWSRVFRPNSFVPDSTYRVVLIAEVVLLLGAWLLMPSIIPSPARVFGALLALIREQGLIGELWTSLTLNLEAIALSTGIALIISYGASIAALRPVAGLVARGRFLSLIGMTFLFTVFVGGGHPLK